MTHIRGPHCHWSALRERTHPERLPLAHLGNSGHSKGLSCGTRTPADRSAVRCANIAFAVSTIFAIGVTHAAPLRKHRREDDAVDQLQEVVVTAKELQLKSLKQKSIYASAYGDRTTQGSSRPASNSTTAAASASAPTSETAAAGEPCRFRSHQCLA